jgi:hypothetical protein
VKVWACITTLLFAITLTTACGGAAATSTPAPTASLPPTHTPPPTAVPSPTAAPIHTPIPTATPTPTITPTPLPTPVPLECLDSAYVADVTIRDNTRIRPGETFIKTWRVRNNGDCPWPYDTQLRVTRDGAIIAPDVLHVGTLDPGAETEISIEMTAPPTRARHRETRRLASGSDGFFGTNLTVVIRVTGAPVPTPVAPSATPTQPPQPTATPTRLAAPLRILHVDRQAGTIGIHNDGEKPQDLFGWILVSENGDQRCTLAAIIEPDATLRVHAMSGANTLTDVYCNFDSNVWNDGEPEAAALYDAAGNLVDRK